MPVTYDSATNTITITGGTESNPYTFEDIYQADQTNGWGVFTKLSEGVYKTTAKLQFGDGNTPTYFKEKGTVLIAENLGTATGDVIIRFKRYCYAQFGEYQEIDGEKVTENGVEFVFRETTYDMCRVVHDGGSDVKYYGCKFKLAKDGKRIDIEGDVKEIIGCLSECLFEALGTTLVKNTILIGKHGHISGCGKTTFENIFIVTTQSKAIWLADENYSLKGLIAVTPDHLADAYRFRAPHVFKFINCKPNNWIINWRLESGDESGEIQRVYTVRFKVTDINGNPLNSRVIKVYDRNNNLIAEAQTDENGLTEEVEILYAKLTNPYDAVSYTHLTLPTN